MEFYPTDEQLETHCRPWDAKHGCIWLLVGAGKNLMCGFIGKPASVARKYELIQVGVIHGCSLIANLTSQG